MRNLYLLLCLISCYTYAGDMSYDIVTVNGKKGLKDKDGNMVIPAKYDEIGWEDGTSAISNGMIGYQLAGKWGLITVENVRLTSPKYSSMLPFVEHKFIASITGKFSKTPFYGLISEKGKPIIDFKYYALKPAHRHLVALVNRQHRYVYGMIDEGGKVVLNFDYQSIVSLSDHLVKAVLTPDKMRIYNTRKTAFVPGDFSRVSDYQGRCILIQKGQLSGVMSYDGNIILDPLYEEIKGNAREGWKVKSPTVWSILDEKYHVIKTIETQRLIWEDGLIRTNSKIGDQILNTDFEAVTPAFDQIVSISGNKVLYETRGQYGLYDMLAESYMKMTKFDTAYISGEFVYGAKNINNQPKWALYDTFGVKRTHFDYEQINAYQNGLLAVKRRGHWGFMDRRGNEVIHCVYDEVGIFKDNLVVVRYHGQYGVINKQNEWVVLPQQNSLEIVNEELFLSRSSRTTQLINISGELIYFTENILESQEDVLVEKFDTGEQMFISLQGTFLNEGRYDRGIHTSYEDIKYLGDDFIAVKKNGRYGFVNKENLLRITNRYEDVGRYSESGIPIKLLGKWGMINTEEEIVIQPVYDSIEISSLQVYIVELEEKYGLISSSGKELITPRFDAITKLDNGEYIVRMGDKYGLVSTEGKYLIDVKYDELIRLNHNEVIVKKRNKYGTVTAQGVEVIPRVYDDLYYVPNRKEYFAKNNGEWKLL